MAARESTLRTTLKLPTSLIHRVENLSCPPASAPRAKRARP
jgi:hypothetical protein